MTQHNNFSFSDSKLHADLIHCLSHARRRNICLLHTYSHYWQPHTRTAVYQRRLTVVLHTIQHRSDHFFPFNYGESSSRCRSTASIDHKICTSNIHSQTEAKTKTPKSVLGKSKSVLVATASIAGRVRRHREFTTTNSNITVPVSKQPRRQEASSPSSESKPEIGLGSVYSAEIAVPDIEASK